jgi:hypothetical protein
MAEMTLEHVLSPSFLNFLLPIIVPPLLYPHPSPQLEFCDRCGQGFVSSPEFD